MATVPGDGCDVARGGDGSSARPDPKSAPAALAWPCCGTTGSSHKRTVAQACARAYAGRATNTLGVEVQESSAPPFDAATIAQELAKIGPDKYYPWAEQSVQVFTDVVMFEGKVINTVAESGPEAGFLATSNQLMNTIAGAAGASVYEIAGLGAGTLLATGIIAVGGTVALATVGGVACIAIAAGYGAWQGQAMLADAQAAVTSYLDAKDAATDRSGKGKMFYDFVAIQTKPFVTEWTIEMESINRFLKAGAGGKNNPNIVPGLARHQANTLRLTEGLRSVKPAAIEFARKSGITRKECEEYRRTLPELPSSQTEAGVGMASGELPVNKELMADGFARRYADKWAKELPEGL